MECQSSQAQPFKPSICNQPWNTIYVPWDGISVRPCCFGPHNMGDFNTSTLPEIWNGPGYQRCRRGLIANQGVDTCVECLAGRRIFTDHIGAFADGLKTGYLPANDLKRENFERARQSYLAGEIEVKHWPYVIYLDVSSKCQIRCRKCYVYSHMVEQPPVGHLKSEIFKKIVPFLPYVVKVVCTGNGESLLHPDFMTMLQLMSEHQCVISFNTNGNTLRPEVCKRLVELGVWEVVFSIDSIDDQLYAYHHRGGKLSRVMENLETIRRTKREMGKNLPVLLWFFVGMKSNLPELPRVLERAVELGFQALYVERLIPSNTWMKQEYRDFYDRENLVSPDDQPWVKETLQKSKELAAKLGIGFSTGYPGVL